MAASRPRMVEEHRKSSIVRDRTGQASGFCYFNEEPHHRSAKAGRRLESPIRSTCIAQNLNDQRALRAHSDWQSLAGDSGAIK